MLKRIVKINHIYVVCNYKFVLAMRQKQNISKLAIKTKTEQNVAMSFSIGFFMWKLFPTISSDKREVLVKSAKCIYIILHCVHLFPAYTLQQISLVD